MRSHRATGPLNGPRKSRCQDCHRVRARLGQSCKRQFHGKVLKLVRSPVVAGKARRSKTRAPMRRARGCVRPCRHLHFDESKGASCPDHERLHNMFLSEDILATVKGHSRQIATKSLARWDLAIPWRDDLLVVSARREPGPPNVLTYSSAKHPSSQPRSCRMFSVLSSPMVEMRKLVPLILP